jgi:hypothetical protein
MSKREKDDKGGEEGGTKKQFARRIWEESF